MSCSSKCSAKVASLVFALIAVGHLLRVIFGWSMVLNGMNVPTWASIVAIVITGALSLCLCRSACCGSGCCGCACCKKDGDKKGCCDKPAAGPSVQNPG